MLRLSVAYDLRASVRTKACVWANLAQRRLVGPTDGGFYRAFHLHRVFHVGRIAGNELHVGSVSFPVLFARNLWIFAARAAGAKARLVAGMAAIFASVVDSLGARNVPVDVLLLSRGLLQSVLGGPAVVHCQRAAKVVLGRAILAAPDPKLAPLLFLHWTDFPGVSCA